MHVVYWNYISHSGYFDNEVITLNIFAITHLLTSAVTEIPDSGSLIKSYIDRCWKCL